MDLLRQRQQEIEQRQEQVNALREQIKQETNKKVIEQLQIKLSQTALTKVTDKLIDELYFLSVEYNEVKPIEWIPVNHILSDAELNKYPHQITVKNALDNKYDISVEFYEPDKNTSLIIVFNYSKSIVTIKSYKYKTLKEKEKGEPTIDRMTRIIEWDWNKISKIKAEIIEQTLLILRNSVYLIH